MAEHASCPEVSLSSVVSPTLRNIVTFLDPCAPLPSSSNTVKKLVIDKANQTTVSLKEEFKDYRHFISATIDIWTDPSMLHSYIGTTLHFVKSTKLVARYIGVVELTERHTAENVKSTFVNQLQKFGLNMEDLYAIITDNGSNMKKAFNIENGN